MKKKMSPFWHVRKQLFHHFEHHYEIAIAKANHAVWGIMETVPSGRYHGEKAAEILTQQMARLEHLLAGVARIQSAMDWLIILRCLRMVEADVPDPFTFKASMRTVELIAVKYGAPLGVLARTSLSGRQLFEARATMARDYPKLIDVTKEKFEAIMTLIQGGMAYHDLTVYYRRIGKGAELVVQEERWDTVGSPDVERLLDLYDRRMEQHGNLFEALGLVYDPDAEPRHQVPFVFSLRQRGQGESVQPHIRHLKRFGIKVEMDERGIRYLPGALDLRHIEELAEYLKDTFQEVYGISWEFFAACIVGLGMHVLMPSKSRNEMEYLYNSDEWLRGGFAIVPTHALYGESLGDCAGAARLKYYPDLAYPEEQWIPLQGKFLDMARTDPDKIDLCSRQPHGFFVFALDLCLVDFSTVPRFLLEVLRLKIGDDATRIKGKKVEESIASILTRESGLAPCSLPKKFTVRGIEIGEADLMLRMGSVCVLVEIKARYFSIACDRGDFKAVRNRWSTVSKWLERVDEFAASLAAQPQGDKYDLRTAGFTHVFPILCTPFHEWIGTTEEMYFLTPEIPRIATPSELNEFLSSATEQQLKLHPRVFPISEVDIS